MTSMTSDFDYLREDLVRIRHDLHRHPELGFEETRTADTIARLLESYGLEVHRGLGKTGVVGVLKRGNGTHHLAMRADIDALPINEINSFGHASVTDNIMHACGHDGHTTMLLGAARHLAGQGKFSGTAVFIFQPNEEHGLGAAAMIEDGLFEQFEVEQVYGMHNIPGMPVGHFATRGGPITASESLFKITVNAQGGHAALPHMGVDAIVVGSSIVNALQTIVSRKLDPGLNGVVSITEFGTDGKRNVLPGKATLSGDARALTPQINQRIEDSMRQLVAGVCSAHGVSADVEYQTIFPPTINDPTAAGAACQAARRLVGSDQVDGDCAAKLFSEDFAHMTAAKPGCYMLMGNGTSGSHARALHSADYDFNDAALLYGCGFWVTLVEQQLVN